MASVTSNPSATGPLVNRLPGALALRIEPPSDWFELRLEELWSYRELLFFLVWRDAKVRCHRRFLGNRAAAAHHARRHSHVWQARQTAAQGLPYSAFCFAAIVLWIYFSRLFASVGIVILLAFGGLLFSNHMEGSIADKVQRHK